MANCLPSFVLFLALISGIEASKSTEAGATNADDECADFKIDQGYAVYDSRIRNSGIIRDCLEAKSYKAGVLDAFRKVVCPIKRTPTTLENKASADVADSLKALDTVAQCALPKLNDPSRVTRDANQNDRGKLKELFTASIILLDKTAIDDVNCGKKSTWDSYWKALVKLLLTASFGQAEAKVDAELEITTLFMESAGDREQYIREKLETNWKNCPPKVAVFLGGGAASGKSTISTEIKLTPDCELTMVDIDEVMMRQPEFKQKSDTAYFGKLYRIAKEILADLVQTSVGRGRSFIVDGTMAEYCRSLELAKTLAGKGYELRLAGVSLPTAEALNRAYERGKKTGRFTDLCYLVESHRNFAKNFPKYVANGLFGDRVVLYDSSDSQPLLIYEKGAAVKTEKAARLYKAFLENPSQTLRQVAEELFKKNREALEKYRDLANLQPEKCDLSFVQGKGSTLKIIPPESESKGTR